MSTTTTTDDDKAAAMPLARAILEGDWVRDYRLRVMSGVQAFETVGTEPNAVEPAIIVAAARLRMPVITWNCYDGFEGRGIDVRAEVARLEQPREPGNPEGLGDPGLCQPLSALAALGRFKLPRTGPGGGSAVFVLHNFYPFFIDPPVAQLFENLVRRNNLCYREHRTGAILRRPIHFIQAPYARLDLRWIETVRHWITPLPFPLPTEQELREGLVADLIAEARRKDPDAVITDEYRDALVAACRGLERHQVTNVLFYAGSKFGSLAPEVPATIRREAGKRLAEATALEVVDEAEIVPPEQLGGIKNAVALIEAAARTCTPAAQAEGLDQSIGVYLIGMPGCGKSELAKTASVLFQRITHRAFTVLRVKMGALYGGIVGDTEHNWYDVERRVDSFGPDTIVWIDECDKVFGGVLESSGDSGVRRSLFGLVLAWLSNPRRRCFVVAAMNSPEGIPGEFFRRFDGGFFFDLPAAAARREIARIHFAKRLARTGKDLDSLGLDAAAWDAIAAATAGWIPSEIEIMVKRARDVAFAATGVATPTAAQIMAVVAAMKGAILSVQKADQLAALRALCKHAHPVDRDDAGDAGELVSGATAPGDRTRSFSFDPTPE